MKILIIILLFSLNYHNTDSCKVARQKKMEFRKQKTEAKLDSILVKLKILKNKKDEKIRLSENRSK